ncbi:MAG: type II toxin-antitoxin system HicA family toxin [Candidatus Omnitrophica bacterium]|nr:type II toxin-antitoxin system HicA family toxin [Candidatus Omnitrophota bacterium]
MKLPRLSGRQLVRALGRAGYLAVSQRGSHIKLRHTVTGQILIVPDHRELDRGTLRGILRDAEISPSDFMNLL